MGSAAGGPDASALTPSGRRRDTLATDYFESMYAHEFDSWQFATSPYERDK